MIDGSSLSSGRGVHSKHAWHATPPAPPLRRNSTMPLRAPLRLWAEVHKTPPAILVLLMASLAFRLSTYMGGHMSSDPILVFALFDVVFA